MPAIRFTPSKKQFLAYQKLTDQETDFVGYGGSAFSGKSYLLCYWLTIMALGYANTGWGLGRKELTVLKKTTLITLFKVFAECGIEPETHYRFNGQSNIITFYNKSQIFLIDTAYKPSDPLYTRFGGLELTGAAVDESAETDLKAIEILYTRLGRRGNIEHGIRAKLLETFNPDKNHVYRRYYQPYKSEKQLPGYAFIKALPADNPSPEVPAYIEGIMRTASQVTIQRLVYGNFEFDDDPSALIQYDKILDMWSNTHVASGNKYITCDAARFGGDMAKIAVWDGWRVISWASYPKSAMTFLADEIERLMTFYSVPASNVVVDEDGVGGGIFDIFKDYKKKSIKGFINNSSPLEEPSPDGFVKPNYKNLKSQCSYRLADRINKGGVFFACEIPLEEKGRIIQDLEQIKQKDMDKDGKKAIVPKEDIKELIGRSPDGGDCLMFREYFELKPPARQAFFR
jgi:phage terminase large subunit